MVNEEFRNHRSEDRRNGPDYLTKWMARFSIGGWALMLLAAIFLFLSQPEMNTGFLRYGGVETRTYWLQDWLHIAYPVLVISTGVSAVSLLIRTGRSRRRLDNPIAPTVVLAIGSLVVVTFVGGLLG